MGPMKRMEDSLTEQQYLICPAHINHYGRLFGGQLLKWIDELAGIVAIRHCGSTVTTAAIDNLQFQAPAYTGDMIVVAIDCKGRPKEVPGLLIETQEQRTEWDAAQKRRQMRKQRRTEGF